MRIVDRKTKNERILEYSGAVKFLYTSLLGRVVLWLINNRLVSKIVGCYMNSKLSKRRINKTIKSNNIDMSLFAKKEYTSFNDFFTRRKKELNFDMQKDHFVAPADSKLLAIKLNNNSSFDIKGSVYTLKDIVKEDLTDKYQNGYALIFRLEVSDYHRYHFIDDGERSDYKYIKGRLNTVQPIAYNKKIFHTNSREYTTLHTKNFGDVIEVDVGAMLVGKITNNKEIIKFKKGDEKGYFEFGGSTIILFVQDRKITVDNDILLNSTLGKETVVSCGERIATKYQELFILNKVNTSLSFNDVFDKDNDEYRLYRSAAVITSKQFVFYTQIEQETSANGRYYPSHWGVKYKKILETFYQDDYNKYLLTIIPNYSIIIKLIDIIKIYDIELPLIRFETIENDLKNIVSSLDIEQSIKRK